MTVNPDPPLRPPQKRALSSAGNSGRRGSAAETLRSPGSRCRWRAGIDESPPVAVGDRHLAPQVHFHGIAEENAEDDRDQRDVELAHDPAEHAEADGRLDIGYNVLGSYALSRQEQADRFGIVYPSDYTLTLSRAAFVPRHAENAEMGNAFVSFTVSPQGQHLLSGASNLFAPGYRPAGAGG